MHGSLSGAEVLAHRVINQGLVRFLAADGNHDACREVVIQRMQDSGAAWFDATTWHGMRVMWVSVCNWRTSEEDVRRRLEALG